MTANTDSKPWRGTTTTIRVDRPDGTATEVVHHDDARVSITRIEKGGAVAARFLVEIQATGDTTFRHGAADEPLTLASPSSTERHVNPYGTTIERADYEGVVSVANTFDDEGRFRSVSLQGDWGEQKLELWPDGARTVAWESPLHHGKQSWDAGGQLDHYEVTFSDTTSYRWDRSGGVGRAVITGWGGETTIVE